MRPAALVLAFAFGVPACATPSQDLVMDFTQAERHLRSDDYPTVYERWSRHQKVISEAGTVIEVWATLESPEFREAYVERYSDIYRLSDAEREALHATQAKRWGDFYEFHITAQSTEYKWNDFEKRDSPWKVTLVDAAGNAVAPIAIEAPRLPELYESAFFPNRSPFTRTYVIRFERETDDRPFAGAGSGRLMLRFASPFGEATLVWRSQ